MVHAQVAELADAQRSGRCGPWPVEVQILSWAQLYAPLAQLVRATDLHSVGQGFESLRVHKIMDPIIIQQTKDYLVINKPSGLVVHPDGRTKEITLCDWVLKNYPEIAGVGEPLILSDGRKIDRPGIVHRLDRETSGVMVIAKNQEMFESLKKQFQDHEIQKVYHAFVHGNLKSDSGVIDRPIAKSKSDFRKWSAERGSRGEKREATTEYKVLKRLGDCTLIEARPKTGRTHQIRVHMKAIGNPLVGDRLYAASKSMKLGFKRTALHARNLSFKDLKGKTVSFDASYPEDFAKSCLF